MRSIRALASLSNCGYPQSTGKFNFQEDMLQAAPDLVQRSGGKVSMKLRQVSADGERLGHAALGTSATAAVEKSCELGCCLCQGPPPRCIVSAFAK